MLSVKSLRVQYGRIAGVRDVSFDVRAGEVVGLIGPNGAGKTSTLSAIVGLVRPAGGSIELDGESLVGKAPEDITRAGIALVPEGRRIFGTLTVGENLKLGLIGQAQEEAAGELDRVLELFPVLRGYYSSSAGRLSGGEQQQLAIARALLLRPRLLLLDEPSLGLAPRIVDLVFDALARLRESGVTIVLVEQVAKRTIRFADRTCVLRNGQVALAGTRQELLASSEVSTAYLGF